MKDLEKQIEESAHNDYPHGFDSGMGSSDRARYERQRQSFIFGAKSQAAKEYWQQGMYSEEEVKALIQKFNKDQCASTWYDDDEEWFNQNKKKRHV